MTTPWVVSGQTTLPLNDYLTNPTPNELGVLGEIHSLPYTVPAGKQLRLLKWGCEAYPPTFAKVGMNLWVGTAFVPEKCLPTVNVSVGVGNDFISARGWVLPAGTILNMSFYNFGPTDNIVDSWWIEGVLETA